MRRFALVLSAALLLAPAAGAQTPGVRAVFAPAGAASAPRDAGWGSAPEATLALSPQIILPPHGGGSVTAVRVRAMHDGEWLAIRLEWEDASADRAVGGDTFRDAAAVGFPVRESEVAASPFMGDAEHPVNRLLAPRPGRVELPLNPPGLGSGHRDAALRQAVIAPTLVVFSRALGELFDQCLLEQAGQRAIQGAGVQRHGAAGSRVDLLHDPVAVLLAVCQGQQNLEGDRRQRQEMFDT